MIRNQRFLSSAILAASCSLAAACAVTVPPQISSSTGAAPSAQSVHLIEPDKDQAQLLALHSALKRSLAAKGITVAEDADVVGEFSLSQRAASLGVFASEAGNDTEPPRPVTEPRKARLFDLCEAVKVEANLALFDRASGRLVQQSKAQGTICEGKEPPMDEFAEILVSELANN